MKRLSAREQQMMDIIFRLGEATAASLEAEMADPPSNATIRTILRILEEKGQLRHRKEGRQFVYSPTTSRERAKEGAVDHLIQTFFGGSARGALAELLSRETFDEKELDELSELIEQSRKKES